MKSGLRMIGYLVAVVALISGCASYEGAIPIDTPMPEVIYISPADQDGIQDVLEVNLQIPQIEGLVIWSYEFTVVDKSGKVIYSESESKAPGTKGKEARTSLPIPARLVWDGKTSGGEWAPDGEYTYQISAKGSKEQAGSTPSFPVVVDNTAPFLVLSVPYHTFSPNGDGRQDSLPVSISEATEEVLWEGFLTDTSEKIVYSMNWEGVPVKFSWPGTSENGETVTDGRYIITASSTDLAGNSFSVSIDDILVDTSPSTLTLTASQEVLSPNRDGILDDLVFTATAGKVEGVKSWKLTVVNEAGTALRTWTGEALPGPIRFDGMADGGRRLPDGEFYGQFLVSYVNGDQPQTFSEKFMIDTVAPTAAVTLGYKLFSPDGDGRRDSVSISQNSSMETLWTTRILNAAGNKVRETAVENSLMPFVWDGTDASGKRVPDGLYVYEVTSTDAGGNKFLVRIDAIVVDTRPTPVQLSSDTRGLSPNGDGTTDTIRFVPAPVIRDGISSWVFQASNPENKKSWTVTGDKAKPLPGDFVWDGRIDDGSIVDGLYDVSIVVEYEKGNRTVTALETTVMVDTTPPTVAVDIAPLPFSPDDDGFNDALNITPAVTDMSAITSWNLSILDPRGNPFYQLNGAGAPKPLKWNGKGSDGELVRSAEDYSMTFTATDEYGNTTRTKKTIPVDILVIREGDRYRISISSIYFKPNTADYQNIEADLAQKNLETLDKLAVILKKFGTYRIFLEGHANRIFWSDPARWKVEEADILVPLSTQRSQVIKDALVARGIPASRMTAEGFGGTQPLVPFSDETNRWKNRRVEFILAR